MITFILSLAALVIGYIFYGLGIACLVVAAVWFTIWYNKQERNQQ